jgi:hypothetical protein
LKFLRKELAHADYEGENLETSFRGVTPSKPNQANQTNKLFQQGLTPQPDLSSSSGKKRMSLRAVPSQRSISAALKPVEPNNTNFQKYVSTLSRMGAPLWEKQEALQFLRERISTSAEVF